MLLSCSIIQMGLQWMSYPTICPSTNPAIAKSPYEDGNLLSFTDRTFFSMASDDASSDN